MSSVIYHDGRWSCCSLRGGEVSLPLSPRPDFEKKRGRLKRGSVVASSIPKQSSSLPDFVMKGVWKEGQWRCHRNYNTMLCPRCHHVKISPENWSYLFGRHCSCGGAQSTSCGFERRSEGCEDQPAFWYWNKTTLHWTFSCHHCNTYSKKFGWGWIK